MQQQPLQLPSQQPNLDPMAYPPIAKLDNFTSEEDNAQIWLNDVEKAIVANRWNNTTKPQIFNEFKTEFLRYFSNNNSTNHLTNTFTTIKQGDTEAVTTYLGRFHRNLRQIQAIQADYFTAPQILNQFIRGLCSSILQQVCPMHSVDLPTTVTHAKDFEAAELEANYTQAVNLVMNGSSDLNSKLKQFSDTINQKLEGYLVDNYAIYQPPQRRNNSRNTNCFQNQPHPSTLSSSSLPNQLWQPETCICHNCDSESLLKSRPILNHLPANDATTNLSTASILTSNLSITATGNPRPRITQNWRLAMVWNLGTGSTQNPNSQNYLSFLVTPKDAITNNLEFNPPQTTLTNNIPPAMITKNESLTAIFPFELEETINPLLFSKAVLKEKPITVMYTDMKVDGHFIKLILDSRSADSIITRQLMDQLGCQVDCAASTRIIIADGVTKTPIGEIDDFPIKVNGIIVPIKVLVMEATQYQALIETPKSFSLARTPITTPSTPLIKFKKEKVKPTWEAYQVSWADVDHNKLLPILVCDNNNNKKEKQREEPTWEATINTWTDNNQSKMPPMLNWKEKNKKKGKGRKENILEETTTVEEITSGWEREYSCEPIKELPYIPLKCKDCEKKLSSMGTWVVSAIENNMAIQKDKASGTTNHVLLVANNYLIKEYEMTFLVKEEHATLSISCLDGYPHDKDEIWRMANTKVEGALLSEILEIKNNSPKPTDIVLVLNLDAFIDLENSPKEFHEHYQNLALIKEEQNCTLELESSSNSNSNSNKDDNKNNSSSFIQNGYNNDNNSNSNSNSDLNYEQYIALLDLTKKQELKWFSDNDEGIMPECAHNTDAGFDLRYLGKNVIKLEPYSRTYIDLKIALEILTTTIVQLASRSSLTKKRINIKGRIINTEYIENIIAMLQNDSEKTYVIELNERIAQAIFLPLVKIAQLVSVGNREELGITARGIQEFESTGRIDIPVNMVEKEIIGQEKIISTSIIRQN
ncbi:hypothetical protein G9A89_010184 [Geosiphon pyriformis]|nr:hypothetical protein G9A89_010184 [Geosiphon pyriformis]